MKTVTKLSANNPIDTCALIPHNTVIIEKTINLGRLTETAHGIQDLLLGIKHIQKSTGKNFVIHHNLIKTILQQTAKDLENTVNQICHITPNQNLPLTKAIKEHMFTSGLNKLTEKLRNNKRLFKYNHSRARKRRDMSYIIPGVTPVDTRSDLVNHLSSVIKTLQTEIKNNTALLEAVDHTVIFMAAAIVAQNEAKLLKREINEITAQNSNLYPHIKSEISKLAQLFTHSAFRVDTLAQKNRLYRQIFKNARTKVNTSFQNHQSTQTSLCENQQIIISIQVVTPKPDSACFTQVKKNKFSPESNNLYAFADQEKTSKYLLDNDKTVMILDPLSTIITTQEIGLVWSAPARWIVTEAAPGTTLACTKRNNTVQKASIFQGTIIDTSSCTKIASKQLSYQKTQRISLGNTTDKLLESATKEVRQFTESYMERRLQSLGETNSIDESIREHLKQAAWEEDKLRERVQNIEESNWINSLVNKIKIALSVAAAAIITLVSIYSAISLIRSCRKRQAKKLLKEEREQSNMRMTSLERSVKSMSSFLEMKNNK